MQFEIGVIRRQCAAPARPPKTIAESAAFTSEIANRCAPRRFTASRAELALAYQVPAQVNYFEGAQMDIAPTVTIHDHFTFPRVGRALVGPMESGPALGEAQVQALFERLLSGRKRVAAFMEGAVRAAAQPSDVSSIRSFWPALGAEPAERILPRTLPPQPGAGASRTHAADNPSTETGWGTRAILPALPKPFSLPEPEVKRVTEQVIREIDHRITAQRERMGRR
jgi:hypothetical protein